MTNKVTLEELKKVVIEKYGRFPLIDKLRFEKLEKDLEVLNILKKKKVDLNLILGGGVEEYNMCCYIVGNELTEEEFNLIKEWLEE